MTREFAIIPAVDVLDGRAVRLYQGDYDRIELDAGDPLALISKAASFGPPLVHVVALGAARDGGAPVALARAAVEAAVPVPVQFGGGVRSIADAGALVEAGVERVVVGSAFELIDELVAVLGERLALSIDVADGLVRTKGWRESSGLSTAAALARCSEVATVVCTAIERDGSRCGPNLELLREARAAYDGRLLAAGGIRDAADIEAVRALGADGVVVGRAWLEGTLAGLDGGASRPGR
jgi:phosphoribosylformimino-5-aminoimidazole carboxamide ribotide isomerase